MPSLTLADLVWQPSTELEGVARFITQARKSLCDLHAWLPAAGLPGWCAAVAVGDGETEMGIPTIGLTEIPDHLLDLVDAIRTLGRLAPPPGVRAPLAVVSAGTLLASRATRFAPRAAVLDPRRRTPIRSEGARWGANLQHSLPATLSRVLQDFLVGPPAQLPDEVDKDWSDRRYLWWAAMAPRLSKLRVKVEQRLGQTQVSLIDRPRPRLTRTADGSATLTLDPSSVGMGATELERALAQLHARPGLTPSLRVGRQTMRVMVSARGRQALPQLFQLRERIRREPHLLAAIRDAPESLFDPELFDLSEYSERVVGVDFVAPVYRARRAPGSERWTFVSGSGDGSGPEARFTPAQQAAIWAAIREAAGHGKPYAFAEGCWFRVPPPEVVAEASDPTTHAAQAELQVKQNIEALEHSADDTGSGHHAKLPQPLPGLAPHITLFPHQESGVAWLAGHALWDKESSDHGMLADDMGLGKTLQVLCLMNLLLERGSLSPMLLVAPLSLLDNWEAEADKFFPGRLRRPLRLGGPTGLRGATADRIRSSQWTLASYEGLRRNQLELGKVRFSLMVLDESHIIRNPSAGVTRATLAMHADRRLALTGTPVQNRLADLWSQFDWLSPGWLGDLSTFDQKHAAAGDDEALHRLRNTVAPRILRRMKRRVLADKLPPLHDAGPTYRPALPMPPDQASLYEAVLRDKSADGKRGSFGLLHRLFQVCACPNMVADRPVSDPKHDWLMSLLDDIQRQQHKVLIFAEWYELQDRLIRAITERFGVFVDRVNGQVVAGDRLSRVNRFNQAQGFAVLVLGPKAAGVGLNITGANHVVHYTRHWNPAHEAQATDRAYRIGQTRPVHVYRPIVHHPTQTSLEVHLDGLLRSKEALAEEVIVPSAQLRVGSELKNALRGL